MTYQYGASITVVTPAGKSIQAQVGEMTDDGPVIIVPSYQMEVSANQLRAEGWQVPEFEAAHTFALEVLRSITNHQPLKLPTKLKFHSPPLPKQKVVGRDPYIPTHGLPRCQNCGSPGHKSIDCPNRGTHVV
jgi:hypothetical protein